MQLKEIINNQNESTRRRLKKKPVVGTSIGLWVEAATVLLLAPKASKESRKKIKREAEWSAQKARQAAQESRMR